MFGRTQSELEIEVRKRFGVLPNFFRLSPEVPQITENLWRFAQAAYLDNPLPSIFKERLFVYLSRFCEARYCIARHVGFLTGLGRPAGDAQAGIQTVDEIVRLLKRPLPRGEQLRPFLAVAHNRAPLGELPDAASDVEEAFFAVTSHVFLETSEAPACFEALKALLDAVRLQYLILLLLFIRSAHYWTKVHPELVFEEDIKQLLATHEGLSQSILHDPEALVSNAISNATVALRESEELLRMAVGAGRMLAYQWDAATDKIVHSEGAALILGEGEGTHNTGQHLLSMIPREDRKRLRAAVAELSPEKPFLRIRHRMVRSDGKVIWVDRNSRVYFDEHGKILLDVGMLADITDRVLAEETLATVTQRLIEAQEQERKRIARELHDDICQRLALLAFGLDVLQEDSPDLPAEVRNRLDELRKRTSEIETDLQSLSHELHSARLDVLGIAAAMRGFCEEFAREQKAEIDFQTHDLLSPLPPDISLGLFRVLQEALHNAAKHSGVRHFTVRLWGGSGEIQLTVADFGKGFDMETVKENRGIGLFSMEERLRILKGTFSIESRPQRGTTIHARVSLSKVKEASV